jgi:hypothetical protein
VFAPPPVADKLDHSLMILRMFALVIISMLVEYDLKYPILKVSAVCVHMHRAEATRRRVHQMTIISPEAPEITSDQFTAIYRETTWYTQRIFTQLEIGIIARTCCVIMLFTCGHVVKNNH